MAARVAEIVRQQQWDDDAYERKVRAQHAERERRAKLDQEREERGDRGRWLILSRTRFNGEPTQWRKSTICGAELLVERTKTGRFEATINEVPLELDSTMQDVSLIKERVDREFTRQKARL